MGSIIILYAVFPLLRVWYKKNRHMLLAVSLLAALWLFAANPFPMEIKQNPITGVFYFLLGAWLKEINAASFCQKSQILKHDLAVCSMWYDCLDFCTCNGRRWPVWKRSILFIVQHYLLSVLDGSFRLAGKNQGTEKRNQPSGSRKLRCIFDPPCGSPDDYRTFRSSRTKHQGNFYHAFDDLCSDLGMDHCDL